MDGASLSTHATMTPADLELETRIERLEQAVEAQLNLDKLKEEVAALAADPVIGRTLQLIESYPTLFDTTATPATLQSQIAIVLGQSAILSNASAQLDMLSQIQVPSVAASNELIEVLPEVKELYAIAAAQEKEIQELTQRSVQVLDDWYRLHVRPMNEAAVHAARTATKATKQVRALQRKSAAQ